MTGYDEAFDTVANSRRRQLLVQLLVDGPQPIPYLSTESRELLEAHPAVLREYLTGSMEVARANKADIRSYHVHLPKLAEDNYIEWAQDAHLVTKGANFDDLRPILELLDDQPDEQLGTGVPLANQKWEHRPETDTR